MATTEKKEPAIKSAGKPEAGEFIIPGREKTETPNTEGQEGGEGNDGDGNDNVELLTEEQIGKLTDEQLLSVLKGKGIDLPDGGLEKLKEKLTSHQPPPPEKTAEEKAAEEKAFEKRMLDHFVKHGGSIDGFTTIKQVASMDLKSLSESEIRRELSEANFTKDEIDLVLRERYYQINPDELTQDDDESEEDFQKRKDFAKRKAEFGLKKFESKASHIKTKAEQALQDLRSAVQTEDLLVTKESEFKSGIDNFAKNFPRKITFQLADIDNQKQEPIDFEVTDADITEALSVLSDPAKRNQYFYQEGNRFNVSNVGELLIRNKILEKALMAAYIERGNRDVAEFEKVFPGKKASDIGIGRKEEGKEEKGQFVSAGKPTAAEFKPAKR